MEIHILERCLKKTNRKPALGVVHIMLNGRISNHKIAHTHSHRASSHLKQIFYAVMFWWTKQRWRCKRRTIDRTDTSVDVTATPIGSG